MDFQLILFEFCIFHTNLFFTMKNQFFREFQIIFFIELIIFWLFIIFFQIKSPASEIFFFSNFTVHFRMKKKSIYSIVQLLTWLNRWRRFYSANYTLHDLVLKIEKSQVGRLMNDCDRDRLLISSRWMFCIYEVRMIKNRFNMRKSNSDL